MPHAGRMYANSRNKNPRSHLIPFIFGICHHKMISNYQHKYESAENVGKEAQVLVVNHLHNKKKMILEKRQLEFTESQATLELQSSH